jgi:F-type H+-transporting ATPase subunit delta
LSSKSTFLNSTSKSYAQALYELAQEKENLNKVESEMKSLKKLLSESIDFKEMLLSPTIAIENKQNIMFLISDQNNFSEVLKKFLGYVTSKNRLFFLGKIIESFLNLVSKNKGELKAKLTSSKKLSSEEKKKIQVELSGEFKSKLDINFEYDSDLISGLIFQVGSTMVDTSLKTKLNKIEKGMIET